MAEKRLIDANALSDLLDIEYKRKMKLVRKGENHLDTLAEGIMSISILLGTMPTVDAVEVVHGRWENFGEHRRKDLRCSVCGKRADNFVGGTEDWYCLWEPNYCPNCGASMRDGDGNG